MVNYQTIRNNGEWYIFLDEAHRGEQADSKLQAYYSVLAQHGFIFQFSATFTDVLDIVTTAFNFNLKEFIDQGYGKHIKLCADEYRDWKPKKEKRGKNNLS